MELGEGIWLSGKTFDCRARDCEFDPPSLQRKLLKRRYVMVLPMKNAPVYQCFTLGTLKNLFCHVWWAHNGSLIETNYMYTPTPNGQIPSASRNKSNTPTLLNCSRLTSHALHTLLKQGIKGNQGCLWGKTWEILLIISRYIVTIETNCSVYQHSD